MDCLIDTNVLLRLAEPAHAMHAAAADAMIELRRRGYTFCVLPQNLIGFWNAATRPADKNGLGFSPAQAEAEVSRIESLLTLMNDTPAIYAEWRRLVVAHAVSGRQVHDARIAAAMRVHGIPHLLTFNGDDFKRYSGITAVVPDEVTQPQLPTP
jgi:predicted nucleic acid-binding protein